MTSPGAGSGEPVETDISLKWELRGVGLAVCGIGDRDRRLSLVPTDLWDGFADLLYGMTNLYGPLATNRFFFDLGADEARWVTRRIEPGPEVEVTVLLLKDMMTSPDLPDSAGEVMWRSRRPRTAFAHAAMNAAQAVLDEYGEDGYLRLCCHPFPTNALLDLRRLHRRLDACAACHRT